MKVFIQIHHLKLMLSISEIKEELFYLEFFRYGVPPHAGFGFGPSRFIMQLLGLSSVKEATFVYRGPKRLRP